MYNYILYRYEIWFRIVRIRMRAYSVYSAHMHV